jgi:hypothetical protein
LFYIFINFYSKLPVALYNEENFSRFCIIVEDPQRTYKDKIENMDIPCIAKVIGYTNLIKKYPTYKDRQQLCNEYDLFFCDYKIYDLLKKPLGNQFYERKK